jgi:ABC-type uncharacterized transport system substrate-binding protein
MIRTLPPRPNDFLNGQQQVELMKEIIPKLSRVVVFGRSTSPGNAQSLREVEVAAGALKVKLQYLDVLDPNDIEAAFRAATNGRADGVLVLDRLVFASSTQLTTENMKRKITVPTLSVIYRNSCVGS